MSRKREWWEDEEPEGCGMKEDCTRGKPDPYEPDPINQIGRLYDGIKTKPEKVDELLHGAYSIRRINEALGKIYGATAYLLGTILTRTEEDRIRAILLATVEYEKAEYRAASDRGGYRFDREQLWNNYFQGQKPLKEILDRMGIMDLETLETKYSTETNKRPRRRIKGRCPF